MKSETDDLAELDATALAALVRAKEVSPLELVEATIARIEADNPTLNAVIWKRYDEARREASGPLPDGPFRGVPFLVKDIAATLAGAPFAEGSRLGAGYVSPHDSELVARHKRAGLVIVGKTNVPELGILPTTESVYYGPCRNPWDLTRTTGGSSGGAAAAVAAGWVPMAHANGGGSIRIPAGCCGLFGLKPTRARNPLGPDHGDLFGGLVAEHAVTRSVRDSAALLDATAGPDVGDPYWAPPPQRPYVEEIGRDPGQLRVAYVTGSPTGSPVHPECVAAVLDTAGLLTSLGHIVEERMPTVDGAALLQRFMTLWAGCIGWAVDELSALSGHKPSAETLEPLTLALYTMSHTTSARAYLGVVATLQRVARQIQTLFVDYDVLLTPTMAEPPVPLGAMDALPGHPLAGLIRAGAFVPFTPIANITGQPAMSVPLHSSSENLPIGAHFIGRFGDEGTLFRLASQLEAARPWAGKRPPRIG